MVNKEKKKALTINDYAKFCSHLNFNSPVLNLIASCILWHQNRKIALKSISLKPALYIKFEQAMWKLNGLPFESGTPFDFMHIRIERGSILQRHEILPERWRDFQNNIGEKFPEIQHP